MPTLNSLSTLIYKTRIFVLILCDITASLLSTYIAFQLRLDFNFVPEIIHLKIFIIPIIIYLSVFFILGVYANIFRFISITSIRSIFYSCFFYGLILFALLILLKFDGIPRSLGILQPLIFFLIIFIIRLSIPFILSDKTINHQANRTLIYGSGESALQLISAMQDRSDYAPVAFIDDNNEFVGRKINNLKVYHSDALKEMVIRERVDNIFVAISNLSKNKRKEIIKTLEGLKVNLKFLSPIGDFASSKILIENFKGIEISDLIDREIDHDFNKTYLDIKRKKVLITGAGGSIGSELCKQIITFEPKLIIILDHSEFALYAIERKLKEIVKQKKLMNIEIITCIGSIQDNQLLNFIFSKYKPNRVYHSAAYKHVPLLESAICETVKNNLIGTINLIDASIENKCEKFLLVSTDKAVRPTNIMGATKRLSEMYLQAKSVNSDTILSIVRFGNVLESSGSVLPLFKEQIKDSKPLTITHPDVTRYFMSIQEAVSLILQANLMAKGGEVYLLNMGDPVKIIDLAKKVLLLNGLIETLDSDISNKIEFIGLRPGEKLFEELLIDNNPKPTGNNNIFMANENFIEMHKFEKIISDVYHHIKNYDDEKLLSLFHDHVSGYNKNY